MDTEDILLQFGIPLTESIEQVYKSAWCIDSKYILNRNTERRQFDKSIAFSDLLTQMGIPVPAYLRTADGEPYVCTDEGCYVLMKRISGQQLDPYQGDPCENGLLLGRIAAELHAALKSIDGLVDANDTDSMQELDGWIMEEFRQRRAELPQEILDYCRDFKTLYDRLPRQLIHRDLHLGNLLFQDGRLSGYLDFDISQRNVRLFDICYMGSSMLAGNYQDADRQSLWRTIFEGILRGYNGVSALTIDEIKAIPYMFVLIGIIFTAFFSKGGQKELSVSCAEITKWQFQHKDTLYMSLS